MTSEPISLRYTYTEDEYTSAARFFYARTFHTRLNFLLSSLAIIAGFLGIWLTGESLIWYVLMVVGFILFYFSYHVHFITPRLHYQRNPKFREEYELEFSEDGMWFRSKGLESRLDWSFYSKVWETADYYFLLYGKDMFTLIPKRVFMNREHEALFKSILRLKVDPRMETYNLPDRKKNELEEYVPPASPPDWR
jgi:hypothetical protein